MTGLSSKIKGLRFMQRAMDKAGGDKETAMGKSVSTDGDDRSRAEGWIVKASTSSCVVLRGTGEASSTPAGNNPSKHSKGKLRFGQKSVDVEDERTRIVARDLEQAAKESAENNGVAKKKRRKGDRQGPKKKKKIIGRSS